MLSIHKTRPCLPVMEMGSLQAFKSGADNKRDGHATTRESNASRALLHFRLHCPNEGFDNENMPHATLPYPEDMGELAVAVGDVGLPAAGFGKGLHNPP